MNNKECAAEFEHLVEILDQLREKCPWDRKQTNESLRKLTIEETYELADAILSDNDNEICEELGDLLMHLVFYAKIGDEKGAFCMTDVIRKVCKKLIYRHPHVFGDVKVDNAGEVIQNWEQLKMRERVGYKAVLSGVPTSLPAMTKANRIQEKASGVGFDWEIREDVWGKVKEEYDELMIEIEGSDHDKMENEFGDLLFAIVNAARLYDIDPEAALERTNRKFIKRFNHIEERTLAKGISLHDMNIDEMDILWKEAKKTDTKR